MTDDTTAALAVQETGLAFDPMHYSGRDEMMRMARVAVASRLYEFGKGSAEQQTAVAFLKLQAGTEIGLPMSKSLSLLYVIDGKIAYASGLVSALIKQAADHDYLIKELTETRCELVFQRRGLDGKIIEESSVWTLEDARRAGLEGRGSWKKFPKDMLFARALTSGARRSCPGIFLGPVYTPEELRETRDVEAREVAPARSTSTPPRAQAAKASEAPRPEVIEPEPAEASSQPVAPPSTDLPEHALAQLLMAIAKADDPKKYEPRARDERFSHDDREVIREALYFREREQQGESTSLPAADPGLIRQAEIAIECFQRSQAES